LARCYGWKKKKVSNILRGVYMQNLITTLGSIFEDQINIILPHEHVFVDLRTPDQPGYAEALSADVVRLMAPELRKASSVGIGALVECSTVGVGRRVDILLNVSRAANFPIVVPTGIYREPWVPEWAHRASQEELYIWMRGELLGNIDGTGVQAGFIKLSAGDDGLTTTETKILKAAARAAFDAGATIGSHTIRGRVVRDQVTILEEAGLPLQQFVWIHASAEPDMQINLEMARKGVWVEYDFVGQGEEKDDDILRRVQTMLDAGLGGKVLLSMDAGWYDPAQPGGGQPRSWDYFSTTFIPKMHAAGIPAEWVKRLTQTNPFQAFARQT
jgi:phosphotriesterase-related protein